METVLLAAQNKQEHDTFRTISLTTLLAGLLQLIAFNIQYYFTAWRDATPGLREAQQPMSFLHYVMHGGPASLFKYIARAVFSESTNGKLLLAWGAVFHFIIAFLFTAFLFLIYPVIIRVAKHKWIVIISYGLFTWSIMNLVVLPLTNHKQFPNDVFGAMISELILTFTIGLPVTLIAHRCHIQKRTT